MKKIKYVVYREGKFFISRCLNVEVSSFGETIGEATHNLREALELYFEDEPARLSYQKIDESLLGEMNIALR